MPQFTFGLLMWVTLDGNQYVTTITVASFTNGRILKDINGITSLLNYPTLPYLSCDMKELFFI